MNECGLYLGGQELGRLSWEACGSRIRLLASCPREEGLIYRVVVQTEGGERRLGVMLPEHQQFLLRREIPAGEVPLRGFIDRTLPGEAHLPGLPLALSAFSPVGEGRETDIPAAGALLSAQWMELEYFLFPFRVGEACPMVPFLCLTTLLEAEGETYGVFCREKGRLAPLPPSE